MEIQAAAKMTWWSSSFHFPTLLSTVRNLAALNPLKSVPEEKRLQSAAFTVGSAIAGIFSLGDCLGALSILLIFFLILSFRFLHDQLPFLWYLYLASADVGCAAFFCLKKTGFSPLLQYLFGRRAAAKWFIGDDEVDAESPRSDENVWRVGLKVYKNGNFYRGQFQEGRFSGSGIYTFLAQGKYAGDWVNGKYDGYGMEEWENGSLYVGQYKGGLRHGFGVHKLHNGDRYAGEWIEGRYHGRGVQQFSDGSYFAGEFKGGVKHGIGGSRFSHGDAYGGEYFEDLVHGYGVYRSANGQCYEGSWQKGKRHGFGSYTVKGREAVSGEWDCGILKNHLPLSHSNVERAVLSAIKAQKHWLSLPGIEEQVNKAVDEAHRAASAAQEASARAVKKSIG